jgi:NTE family protein
MLISLGGCRHAYQCYHCEFTQTYCPLPEDLPTFTPTPEIILVLGGGGARALAHVGILEEFERAKIPLDLIVGCSAGAIVGSLYSISPNADEVRSILEPLTRKDLIEIDFLAMRYGLGRGDPLKKFLLKHLGATEFHETYVPVIFVATDLLTGEMVQISSGPMAPAVQASCAYPLLFAPVKAYGRVLIDGGVVNPVPVEIAYHYRPKIIIAIELTDEFLHVEPGNLFKIAKRCMEIKLCKHSQSCSKDADIVIRPNLMDISMFDDCCNKEIYESGREAARQAIPIIQQMMSERGVAQREPRTLLNE